jgi:hypothetical protein
VGLSAGVMPILGGMRVPARCSRAYYVGYGGLPAGEWAARLDQCCIGVQRRISLDFDLGHSTWRRPIIVMVARPPGVMYVVRRLGLAQFYNIDSPQETLYLWRERAVLLTIPNRDMELQSNLIFALCQAYLHQALGASWPYLWPVLGYAWLTVVRELRPDRVVERSSLAPLVGAMRNGSALSLAKLCSDEYAETWMGEHLYNEHVYYFVSYLHALRDKFPQGWTTLREHMVFTVRQGAPLLARFETALAAPAQTIERWFAEWCEEQLARLQA